MKSEALHWTPWLASILLTAGSLPTDGAEIVVDAEESLFAVVTHKGGVAAGQAHNHLVTAGDYRVALDFAPLNPLEASFELELAAEDLIVDRWDLEQAWYQRFVELGVLDEPWSELSEKTRSKIRGAMLGRKQLDAAKFPKIAARVTAIREKSTTVGEVSFDHEVTLALEMHGRIVEKAVSARYEADHGEIVVEAVGAFLFSDFGIKPYSAALGLVKNLDMFHVYLSLRGEILASPE